MCLLVCHQNLRCKALRYVYDAIIRCTKSYDNDLEEPAKLFSGKCAAVERNLDTSNDSFCHIFGAEELKHHLICFAALVFVLCFF